MPRALLSPWNCDEGLISILTSDTLTSMPHISCQTQSFLAAVGSKGKQEEVNTTAITWVAEKILTDLTYRGHMDVSESSELGGILPSPPRTPAESTPHSSLGGMNSLNQKVFM